MTTFRVTKNVLSGSADYIYPGYVTTGSSGLVGGDSIELLFDNDVILDDIIVQAVSVSGLSRRAAPRRTGWLARVSPS